ncbi:hypothetical protein BIT28_04780 [Photobacterium proteolyticum]|uniref:Uncharacterized protein n=1 Tax=Photobacterium proteolyticum TaxID=1903952 RepID=A0A1Q9GSH8_9GAMM|nr:hypothetical protein [Photobacterium proteolyticum]OLQ77668.1 hypothetical protein BIT28_04780 [Photobacterium proteolyticum]
MQKGNEFTHATSWVRLLTNQKNQPRLVGILQSSLSLARHLVGCCQLHELMSFYKASDVNRQLMADTIAASGCDTLICDRQHYNALIYILSLRQQPMTVILNQENYKPDWCWQFPQHQFLCQQDII